MGSEPIFFKDVGHLRSRTLKDVIETGANDVYVVETSSHGEVLIPAIKECILEVDVEAGRMVVHLLDGLL